MSAMAVTSTSLIDKRLGRCWRPLPPAPTSAMLTRSLGLARLGVAPPKAKTAGTDAAKIERSRNSLRVTLSIDYLGKRIRVVAKSGLGSLFFSGQRTFVESVFAHSTVTPCAVARWIRNGVYTVM